MKNLFILLFLAVTGISAAQSTITGRVLNENTNEPLIGANVYIAKLDKGSITDLDGGFILENLPRGSYDLLISSIGFSSSTLTIQIPITETLEIKLAPTAIEMEEVIISTPFHQLQSENIMRVERATLEKLGRKGAVNLADGITQISGVESITTGSGIGKPVIRGLSSNRVLVYTQGVRLENQQFGDEHGLGVSGSGIESVEVIKGPASLLYGSDALGGVLYLNPEKYASPNSTEVDAGATYFSNTIGVEANAGVKTSAEKFKYLLRANYASHSDYKTGGGQRVFNSRFNEVDLKTGIGFRNKGYKGDLRYNLNSTQTGIPEGLGGSTSRTMLEPYQEIQNHVLSYDNTFYFDHSSLDVKIGYLFNDRKEFEDHHHSHEHEHDEEDHDHDHDHDHEPETGDEEAALHMKLRTLNYDAKYHFPEKGRFQTIVGIQGMFQSNKNYGEEFLIPDARTTDFGILATTHYHLEKMDVQAGIRFDNRKIATEEIGHINETHIPELERNFNSYNGALGVKFDLFPQLTTRLNMATGFRAPNLAELTSEGSHHGSNRYEVGNRELENEKNVQFDLSLEYRNEHLEVFGNAFYNKLDNYIYLNPTEEIRDENPVYNYVQKDAELYGGEAGIHIHPHPLDWLHLESSYEMVIGKLMNGENLPLIPAHTILNTLRFEHQGSQWLNDAYSFISLKSTFEQSRVSIFEDPTAAYSLLDAGLGGSIFLDGTELQIRITGRNLLDKEYISHLSRLKADGIQNMGRNISVGLKAVF